MKVIDNPLFGKYPKDKDCLKIIFPVNFKIGTIYAADRIWRYGFNVSHQFLRKVTKVEILKDYPNHMVVSSVLIGAIISKNIFEKIQKKFWGLYSKSCGNQELEIIYYYDLAHVEKEDCHYSKKEKTEIFFISTNDQPNYYEVDLTLLDKVKVPIEEDSSCLGSCVLN